MKKLAVKIIAGVAVMSSVFLAVPGLNVQAKSNVREIEIPDDFVYTTINAPDTFMGMRVTYKGIDKETGNIVVRYGQKGSGATIEAYGCGLHCEFNFNYLGSIDLTGTTGTYTTMYDLGIDNFDFGRDKATSVNVALGLYDPNSGDTVFPYDPVPGEKVTGVVTAYPTENGASTYKEFRWNIADFTNFREGDYGDREYARAHGYDLENGPYIGTLEEYRQIFGLSLDEPVTEDAFQTIYDLTKEVSISYK